MQGDAAPPHRHRRDHRPHPHPHLLQPDPAQPRALPPRRESYHPPALVTHRTDPAVVYPVLAVVDGHTTFPMLIAQPANISISQGEHYYTKQDIQWQISELCFIAISQNFPFPFAAANLSLLGNSVAQHGDFSPLLHLEPVVIASASIAATAFQTALPTLRGHQGFTWMRAGG